MQVFRYSVIIIFILSLSSCFRLDDNFFNSSRVESYLLDDYTGEVDFVTGPQYAIPEEKIHLFTLHSGEENFRIYAIYIGDTAKIDQDTVIYYLHGNRDHMDFYWQRAKLLANAGGKNNFGVLMIEFRGFGLSEGASTEQGLYEDTEAGLKWLQEKGLTNDRLVVYGFSMGTGPASWAAAGNSVMVPARLIHEAPYASIDVLVQDAAVLNMPVSFVTNLKLRNAEMIKEVQQPYLWMHGVADDFLDIETHGAVVFKNYNGVNGVEVRVPGANHGDIPLVMGFENYLWTISQFIRD